MADTPRQRPESNANDQAPELHNSEQDDEPGQAQTIADEALHGGARRSSPLDSVKPARADDDDDGSTQDLIDHMRDMEQSGRIDMGAFRGEPNHDDEDDTYGEGTDPEDEETLPEGSLPDEEDEDENPVSGA